MATCLDCRDHPAQRLAFGRATAQTLPPALARHTLHRVWFQWTSAGLMSGLMAGPDLMVVSSLSEVYAVARPGPSVSAISVLTAHECDGLLERCAAGAGVTDGYVFVPDRHATEEDAPVRG